MSILDYINNLAVFLVCQNLLNNFFLILDFVQPICLPKGKLLASNFIINGPVDVAGWGVTDSYTETLAEKLLYVSLNVTDLKTCSMLYGKTFDSQLCIGEGGGRDSCVGDSGLYINFLFVNLDIIRKQQQSK